MSLDFIGKYNNWDKVDPASYVVVIKWELLYFNFHMDWLQIYSCVCLMFGLYNA